MSKYTASKIDASFISGNTQKRIQERSYIGDALPDEVEVLKPKMFADLIMDKAVADGGRADDLQEEQQSPTTLP